MLCMAVRNEIQQVIEHRKKQLRDHIAYVKQLPIKVPFINHADLQRDCENYEADLATMTEFWKHQGEAVLQDIANELPQEQEIKYTEARRRYMNDLAIFRCKWELLHKKIKQINSLNEIRIACLDQYQKEQLSQIDATKRILTRYPVRWCELVVQYKQQRTTIPIDYQNISVHDVRTKSESRFRTSGHSKLFVMGGPQLDDKMLIQTYFIQGTVRPTSTLRLIVFGESTRE